MTALWIGLILIFQAMVFTFAHALCKSAALADREIERAWRAEQNR